LVYGPAVTAHESNRHVATVVREEFQSGIRIESLLGLDRRKLLFRTSAVDGRPAQRDDRAAQNAVVLTIASHVAKI
jgi:hypothetical protein